MADPREVGPVRPPSNPLIRERAFFKEERVFECLGLWDPMGYLIAHLAWSSDHTCPGDLEGGVDLERGPVGPTIIPPICEA